MQFDSGLDCGTDKGHYWKKTGKIQIKQHKGSGWGIHVTPWLIHVSV